MAAGWITSVGKRAMATVLLTLVLLISLFSLNWSQIVQTIEVSGVLLDPTLDQQWQNYKAKFGKRYSGPTEELVRRVIWEENVSRIRAHNARYRRGFETFKMALNRRSDWTRAEIERIAGTEVPEEDDTQIQKISTDFTVSTSSFKQRTTAALFSSQIPPKSVDLRSSPCIPPIKDQDTCGSCWAFAAVAPIEYRICKQGNRNALIILSEQQLVDCSGPYRNGGCDGGDEAKAWEYIKDHGITINCTYPYISKDQTCRYRETQAVATVTSIVLIKPFDVDAMRNVVAKEGPITVSMKIISSFLHYSSGIYYDTRCLNLAPDDVNHALVVVGYGNSKDNIPYWILRNSLGTDWGIRGYVLFRSGVNLCNIESSPVYPHVKLVNNPKSSADISFSPM